MKGILFKEDLFKATLAGRKTQTRRVGSFSKMRKHPMNAIKKELEDGSVVDTSGKVFKPRYKKGEVVYMKEPFHHDPSISGEKIFYKFDQPEDCVNDVKWSNKLFMPEKHARYFIKIKDVFAQTLLSITEEQAKAEGIDKLPEDHNYTNAFFRKFYEINKECEVPLKTSWVWVYDYELVQ